MGKLTREPEPEQPGADPAEDPMFRAMVMMDGLGCLTRNLTGLQSDLYAHRGTMTPEQLAQATTQIRALHDQIEAVCREVGGMRQSVQRH